MTSIKTINMEHFFKENAATAISNQLHDFKIYKQEGCEEKSRTTSTRRILIYKKSNS